MSTLSQYRVRGRRFEALSWFFMRLSGLALLFLAMFHLLYMHLVLRVEKITFDVIVQRWTGPYGWFWSLYDLALLLFALIHGANGARWVIDDYVRSPGWNMVVKSVVYLLVGLMILMGVMTIFRFQIAA